MREKLIHLHHCRGITRRSIRKILHIDPLLNQLYSLTPQEISSLLSLPMKNAIVFYRDLQDENVTREVADVLARYQITTVFDKNYPQMLKTIKDPPLVLYAAGDLSLLCKLPALSVIGTRKPSTEAMEKTNHFLKLLVEHDWIIVSGMAKGIDSYAHIVTLNHNGATIAVLGGGFNHIYPRQNTNLFRQIAKTGLVITEYPPTVPPKPYHFPERNRIISGLSFATLVIEATEKSGTMITVDQALDQGREVYAVPGSPLMSQTAGCHKLIQEGAKLVTSAEDIMVEWENLYWAMVH